MSRAGFFPPHSNALGDQTALPLAWLHFPMVLVGSATAGSPLVTDPLPEGAYCIWVDGAAWVNAGDDGAPSVNPDDTSTGAPKAHAGGDWIVAVEDQHRIAVAPKGGASVNVRIYRVN
jgi:hypothetical protein